MPRSALVERGGFPAFAFLLGCRGTKKLQRTERGGGAGFDAEFDVDVFQVFVHRARAQLQDVGDVFVGFAAGHPAQHFDFPVGELEAAGQFAVGGFVFERDRL